MNETKIYVGLNDSESMKQEHETEKYVKILKNVCYNYHVAFSFSVVQGGYFHEDGEYTQETTLVLTLIDTDNETVNEIAKDLCVFFHQESVMITESNVRAYFINERL
ncbi:MAG: DUF3574 domain-containing protein [Erysipelotrichaceae bacterium]|jgi:hypothetical protein|nr:DUF3574 domain-containing protein [Erysipelotrichaceae bacterium]MBQ1523280.1 DUF3574 domain-containing protein [Erysipelotrichaceae bacterium]MBR2545728.1 DUF3574 domain-containing protein [Erysipelotrichaceae bacterium]MBR2701968.1 DUF3574 domain-containing protein [Erysipelotrichaceae bacterium]MBR2746241.1 DUF3574 domain-containing protein [Erysipelotrichaceae bacterium]